MRDSTEKSLNYVIGESDGKKFRPYHLIVASFILSQSAWPAVDWNTYVTVESSTLGVEAIYSVRDDFYVTTRDASASSFVADIGVMANDPFRLIRPANGRMNLGIGRHQTYKVDDGAGDEDGAWGTVFVLKLDIEQEEVNVSWKTTNCRLNLTSDSYTEGGVTWTSGPAGISGSGKSITFNPSLLTPGEYVVTARTDVVKNYVDTCLVRVVKVSKLTHQIGASMGWREFNYPQKILFGKDSKIRAEVVPSTAISSISPKWDGTYGVRGMGEVRRHRYVGNPSLTDADTKSVFTDLGPYPVENFLVCWVVVGIHSSAGPGGSFRDGHAWLSFTDFSQGSPVVTTCGLWGNKPQTTPGSDVHFGYEQPLGAYNRFYLVKPSELASFTDYITTACEWSYFYTCADWAQDGYRIASGETISASDYVLFGTPRAIGASISEAEALTPTARDIPLDGGEDAPSTSQSSGGVGSESSFP